MTDEQKKAARPKHNMAQKKSKAKRVHGFLFLSLFTVFKLHVGTFSAGTFSSPEFHAHKLCPNTAMQEVHTHTHPLSI